MLSAGSSSHGERESDALRIIGQNANVGCNLFDLPIHLENLDSDAMGASFKEALLQAVSELAETELSEVGATSFSSQERLRRRGRHARWHASRCRPR